MLRIRSLTISNMNKKIIILIAVAVVLAGAGIWYFIIRPSSQEFLSPVVNPPVEEPKEEVSAVGWSVVKDELQAAQESVAMMLKTLKKNPDFAFVYCASGYEEEKVSAEVRRLLPGTKIIGGNSGYGVMTPGGYFWYPVVSQSMAVLGVAAPNIVWGVGSVSANAVSSREAARQALLEAIKNAGKEKTERPSLVINVPSFNMEHDNILKGIADEFGPEVPVFGAYSVDRGIGGDWRVFANDKVFHSGVAVAVVYTDLKIGYFREHGFEITEEGGTVTKAEGKKLIEIDGRPAAEVYNELIGGLLEEEVKNPEKANVSKARLTSVLNPLAKVLNIPGREPFYVPALLVKILPDRSMELDTVMAKGDKLKVLRGDWEILLNRLRTVPQKAIDKFKIEKDKIIFALDSYCCATHYVIPETERPKSPQILKESIGGAPFIVICACGIQIPEPGIGNIYTSLGNGILMFSSK